MSAEERGWWDALKGDEILHNTAGNPPYNVGAVAHFLETVLDLRNSYVLDLGCGPGRLTRLLAEWHPVAQFYGVDIAPSFVDLANADAPHNMRAFVGDGRTIPVDQLPEWGRTILAAYSVTVFQHIPHDAASFYVEQVYNMLAPRGRFAFTWSDGAEDAFLSHQCSRDTVDEWAGDAGFESIIHLTNHDHPRGWRWAVATKGAQ